MQDDNNNSLALILSEIDDIFPYQYKYSSKLAHRYASVLFYLLKKINPYKVAIFDCSNTLTRTYIHDIVKRYNFSSQCYTNLPLSAIDQQNCQKLRYLSSYSTFDEFEFIYIDASYYSLQHDPFLSKLTNAIPKNIYIVLGNVYKTGALAFENSKLLQQWSKTYLAFHFDHYDGLSIIYTGNERQNSLNELFSLNTIPKQAQKCKNFLALCDEYLELKSLERKNEKNNFSLEQKEMKAQINFLEQKNKELNKKLHPSPPDPLAAKIIEWMNQVEPKIKSINYLLEKYCFILRFLPQKLIDLFNFPPLPNLSSSGTHAEMVNYTKTSPEVCRFKHAFNPRRIIFLAGEPHTPGVVYRCHRNAQACLMAGHIAKIIDIKTVHVDDIKWADILVFWRVEYSTHIATIIQIAKAHHTLTAFDADDIVFKTHYASIEIIDGIRTIGSTEAETSRTFNNMRQAMLRTDFAIATTQEMRMHMAQELTPKHAGPLVFILPNVFDDQCVKLSRLHSRLKQNLSEDCFIRIGYASGTRTHQKDFATIVPTLVTLFQKRPQVKLVLFKEPENQQPIIQLNEFPELDGFKDRIEWRNTVPLEQLPKELARFDISVAPLEEDNVFCNAKSELKYFEASLANVCSVLSATGPMKRCVESGVTGFLADSPEKWESILLNLVDDKNLRQTIALNAYHNVLWNFSIQRQSYLFDTMLQSLTDDTGAALATEIMIARKKYTSLGLPLIPENEILFDHDELIESEVTVIVTSYNYSNYVIECLESVRAQNLKNLDLVIVDDCSTDDSVDLIQTWASKHKRRFNRLHFRRSAHNVGLGGARNIGMTACETLYAMQLDADNRLLPDTCEKLFRAIEGTNSGYAYPLIHHFGAGESTGGNVPFHPLRLSVGNYIDAMALVAKWAWAAAGGYYVKKDSMGWEDYDLWCRLAELGIKGIQVKNAVAEYRAHFSSMTTTLTEKTFHKPKVVSLINQRHPWIDLVFPDDSPYKNK